MTVLSLVPTAADATTTGTITAAQSGINTPVSNATVVLAVGTGQSSWKATLTGANFTSGSTIVADHSSDGGTTWFASNFKVAGGTTTVTSIVGPAPVEISGNDASISHIRVRCSVLGGGDSITVAFRSGYGVGSVGLLNSLPAGTNVIGGITSTDLGTTADSSASSDTGTFSLISLFKRYLTRFSTNSIGSLKVGGDSLEVAGQGTGVVNGINTDLIPSTDVSAYKWFSIQLAGTWSATFTAQASNDNTNWQTITLQQTSTAVINFSTMTANGLYSAPITFRYLRIRATTFSSNSSLVGTLELFTSPTATNATAASIAGTWTVSVGPPTDVTLIASAAFGTTQTSADQSNTSGKGVRVVLDMTSVGTGSVTLEIDAKDGASGKYVALLTGAAVITNSTNVYVVYPTITAVTNSIAQDVLPRTWRVKVTANNANSCTYSVGYCILP